MDKKEVWIVLLIVIAIVLSFSLIKFMMPEITTSIIYSAPEKITISLLDQENNIISKVEPEVEEITNISFEHQGNRIEFISLKPKTFNIKFFAKSDKDFIKTDIVAISLDVDFEKAKITLKKRTDEEINVIYKCKIFDFSKGRCKSEWTPTDIEFEQTVDSITFEVSSFSAYAGGTISYEVKQKTICNCSSCAECNQQLDNNSCDIVRLTKDISSNGTCIYFPTDNKIFDCQGHSIRGNGTGMGISVIYYNNNTILNCVIYNFSSGVYLFSADSNTLSSITCYNNSWGIYLYKSSNNNFTDIKTHNNTVEIGIFDFSMNACVNNTFKNIQIASYPTNISFIYDSGPFDRVSIDGVDRPDPDPLGWRNINKYVNITSNGLSWLWLNISYSDSDITNAGINESSLKIWKYNGSDWIESGWNGSRILDTDNNIVGVNITSFSVFAPFGQIIPSVYFVPENIAVPGYCNTTTASIWVNTSVALGAGQLIFYYDPTCMNVTEYAGNNSNWNAINNANLQYGFVEIGFANTYPTGVGPGSIHIGDITVHCVDAGSCCGTLIYWNTTNSYLQDMDTNKIYPVLNNGTFICGQLLKVNKTVWNGTAWVDQLQLPSSWIGKDVIFKITVSATCEDLEDVIINDVMSQGLKYNDAASLVPTSSSAHSVDWTLALLPAGTSQSITFNATITGYGTQTDTANVTATVTNLGVRVQAQDDASVSVIPSLNITVNKTVWDPNSGKWVEGINDAKIGDTYRFKCVITNTGSFDLTNITVWDILSPSMEYADDAVLTTPGRIKYNIDPPTNITTLPDGSTMVNWTIDDYLLSPLTLKPGQSLTIEFNATVINYGNDTNTQFAKGWSPAVNAWAVDNDTAYINTPKSDIVVSDITINYDASNVKNKAIGPLPPGNKTQCNNISATISELNGVDVGFRFNVKFEVNGTKLNCSPVHVPAGALKGGGSVTVYCDCSFYPIAGETYNISVIADSDNEISESDETNNIRWKNVTAIWNGWKGNGWQDGREISTSQCHQGRINLVYSTGDSYYLSGAASPNWTTYEANWTPSDFNIPQASSIVDARLYVYYSYDKTPDGDPTNTSDGYYVNLTFNGYLKTHIAHYTDRKGFGYWDYPFGMIVYDVTNEFIPTGNNTAVLTYTWPSGSYKDLSITGMLLVVVYNHSSEPKRIIWINDGFDLIYAKTSYAVSSEEATAYVRFNGCGPISLGNVIDAKLITVAPHASDGDDFNRLYFNGHVWKGIWAGYAGSTQLGINETDVSGYLKATDNIALFQSHIPTGATKGNHMVASNAFLVVELTNTPPTHSKPFIGAHINPSMNGLVSYWQFEYDNGTHTFDATGRNNGTLHGGVKLVHEGKVGKAYEFDGKDDYINISYTLPDQGTISLWYYAKPWYNFQTIFDNSVDKDDWEMWIYSDGSLTARIESDLYVSYDLDNLGGPNNWYHIAVTWNKSIPSICLYVNGIQRQCDTTGTWVDPGTQFYLGGGNPGNTKGNGTIDEVLIFNRSLSESEIKDLYDLTKGKYALTNNDIGCSPNATYDADNDDLTYIYNWYRNDKSILLLNMPFEGGSNSTYTKDYSSFNFQGNVVNLTWNESCGYEGGCYFRESSQSGGGIFVEGSQSLKFGTEFAIDLWYYPIGDANWEPLLIKGKNYTFEESFYLQMSNDFWRNTTWCEVVVNDSGSCQKYNVRNGTPVTPGVWHHIVCTYNGTHLVTYLDGKLDVSKQISTTPLSICNYDRKIIIARKGEELLSSIGVGEKIDNVRIWNISLSKQQVALLYKQGLNTISYSKTSPGEEWKCSVTLNDGISDSITLNSSSILIQNTKPTVSLSYPSNATIKLPTTLTLNWTFSDPDGDDQAAYHIMIDNNSDFSSPEINVTNNTNVKQHTASLESCEIYYWKVRAKDTGYGSTWSDWSEAWQFRTNCLPQQSNPYIGAHIDPSMNGLISYWQFEYDNGTHTFDATGRNNGTLHGGVKLVHEGKVGKAYEFDGVDDYIYIGNSSSLDINNNEVTIALWVNLHNLSATSGFQGIYDAYEDSYIVYLDYINKELRFKVTDQDGTAERPGISFSELKENEWYFITGVYNGNEGKAQIYLNGILKDTHTNSSLTDLVKPGQKAAIGRNGDKGEYYFDGLVDEVVIFNRSLSDSEIKDLYDLTRGKYALTYNDLGCSPNATYDPDNDDLTYIYNWYRNDQSILLLNMPFEGGSNDTWTRNYGSLEDGIVQNLTWQTTNCAYGGCYKGKGGGPRGIIIPNSENIDQLYELTLEAWFYNGDVNCSWESIISKYYWNRSVSYYLECSNPRWNNKIWCGFNTTAGWNVTKGNTSIKNNTWYHLVCTFNGTDILLYVNGVLDGSLHVSDTPVKILHTPYNITVGRRTDEHGHIGTNDRIDEVRVWSKSLSAEEVKALYERGLNTIVAEETSSGEKWKCSVTLNDGISDSATLESSSISVLEKKPEEKPKEEEVIPRVGGGGRRRRGCFERWNCTEWGPCINGTQTRICYDIGTCKRPPRTETRECVVQPVPTPAPAPPTRPLPPARLVPPGKPEAEIERPLLGLPPSKLYNLLIGTIVIVVAVILIIWALKKHFAYEREVAEGIRPIEPKEKLFEEAAVITEPERRLRERIALEKERKEMALKEALEERRRELERIKREERERRMRMLEERRKLKERIHRISHTLNEFILRGIAQGMSKQEIKALLIEAGWDERFIEKYVDKFFKLNAALIIRLRRRFMQ